MIQTRTPMSKPVKPVNRNIYLSVEEQQYQTLQARRAQTTCRSLTEYVRCLVLQQPVTVNHRNASLEDLITELSLARRQLARVAAALTESAEKMELASPDGLSDWLERHQNERQIALAHIEQIYQLTKQAAKIWLQ